MQLGQVARAWYESSIDDFETATTDQILGTLLNKSGYTIVHDQTVAWREQIEFLRGRLRGLDGWLFFEFNIPRMARRIDVVLLTGGVVFVIEFKTGSVFDLAAADQVWDYALDLKNFHEASHHLSIVPLLVATEAAHAPALTLISDADGVVRPLRTNAATFRDAIDLALSRLRAKPIEVDAWFNASYRPTPTIIEAARALYAQHSVEEIARHDAGAENLRVTSQHIEELVSEARRNRQKVICFVTGVPGAGKTLVGLNVATRRNDEDDDSPAVYLSGNGPLVEVLREALTRDELTRLQARGIKSTKSKVRKSVEAFVQNVHHFRDEALRDPRPPVEHVSIFDEAQRAWNRDKAVKWMRRKRNVADFNQSEPEFLLSSMDRHDDWSVVVCLVGGGQEINEGEAGIDEWLQAVHARFPDWRMHISSRLKDSEYAAGHALDSVRGRPNTNFDECLHLSVSMRSFRAENVSAFVKAVLDRERVAAADAFQELTERYPIRVTRDLDTARNWLRENARGSERYGLVSSSKAFRLKPHAIDVRVNVDPVHWFLDGKDDTRSSYYLEDAATEFQVQGLELDWTCVTWDADLRLHDRGWSFHNFVGSSWQNVNKLENRRYLLNAYRVLLTRARQGMVIFVPPGNHNDRTRLPEYYDETFDYLTSLGLPQLG